MRERLRFRITGVEAELADASARADAALAQLHESDAAMAAVAEQLGHLGSAARAALAEADRMAGSIAQAREAGDRDRATLAELEARLAAARAAPDVEPSTDERDRLAIVASSARAAETEARLGCRYGRRTRSGDRGTCCTTRRSGRSRTRCTRTRRASSDRVASARPWSPQRLRSVSLRCSSGLRLSLAAAAHEREAAEHTRTVRDGELLALRARQRELSAEIEQLTDVVHRDELARAEQRLRIEQLEQRAMEEFGVESDALADEYGPDCVGAGVS